MNHDFNFDGGDILRKMGATWFVSYLYYLKINNTHKNWEKVDTHKSRINTFKNLTHYHKLWLSEVLNMDSKKLSKNKIAVTPEQTKQMAEELLLVFQ